MPIEKETIVERPVEHETVVTDSGGLGAIAGIVAAAVVVLFAIWLFSGGLNNSGNKSVSVDLPKVTVSP